MTPALRENRVAVLRVMMAVLPEREFSTNELAHFARISLPEAKRALRSLWLDGLVRRYTNPAKPSSYVYFGAVRS